MYLMCGKQSNVSSVVDYKKLCLAADCTQLQLQPGDRPGAATLVLNVRSTFETGVATWCFTAAKEKSNNQADRFNLRFQYQEDCAAWISGLSKLILKPDEVVRI